MSGIRKFDESRHCTARACLLFPSAIPRCQACRGGRWVDPLRRRIRPGDGEGVIKVRQQNEKMNKNRCFYSNRYTRHHFAGHRRIGQRTFVIRADSALYTWEDIQDSKKNGDPSDVAAKISFRISSYLKNGTDTRHRLRTKKQMCKACYCRHCQEHSASLSPAYCHISILTVRRILSSWSPHPSSSAFGLPDKSFPGDVVTRKKGEEILTDKYGRSFRRASSAVSTEVKLCLLVFWGEDPNTKPFKTGV